jgi:hypothetical protein
VISCIGACRSTARGCFYTERDSIQRQRAKSADWRVAETVALPEDATRAEIALVFCGD